MKQKHLFRFYVQTDENSLEKMIVSGEEHHHLKKVLRLNVGEEVEFFDGNGLSGLAKIESIQTEKTYLNVLNQNKIQRPPIKKTLAVGALDFKVLDEVLPSIVELGVDELLVFRGEHDDLKRLQPKIIERWQKIVLAACKQSKRDFLLDIRCYDNVKDCLISLSPSSQKILLEKSASQSIWSQSVSKEQSLCILLGSESGLTSAEQCLAISDFGFTAVNLGSLTLRSTTALVSAATVFNYFFSSDHSNYTY